MYFLRLALAFVVVCISAGVGILLNVVSSK